MNPNPTTEEEVLKSLSTPDLVRHALEEARLLARTEVLHAKHELREEIRAAKKSGIFIGGGLVLALCGLAVLFMALAVALPMSDAAGALVVGLVLLLVAGLMGWLGFRALPKQPLPKTTERLKWDWTLAKERLS